MSEKEQCKLQYDGIDSNGLVSVSVTAEGETFKKASENAHSKLEKVVGLLEDEQTD